MKSVENDNNISVKDKKIIKSQLLVIIYGSQDKVPEDKVVTDTTKQQGGFSIINFLLSVLKIFGYIILLVIL